MQIYKIFTFKKNSGKYNSEFKFDSCKIENDVETHLEERKKVLTHVKTFSLQKS